MKKNVIIKIFFLVLAIELVGEVFLDFLDFPYLVYIFKPLLMPLLIFWYKKTDINYLKILVYALVFSLFGDIFLMFLPLSEHFFLAGLASFLITHVLYLVVFIKHTQSNKKSIFWRRPHLALPFILYGLSLVAYLYQNASPKFIEMQIPVILYASVIMLMVLSAIGRFDKVNQKSFAWVLIGALMFMFSDTLIALNNFSSIFDNHKYIARILIMILYALGQYLIVLGIVEQKKIQDAN